VRLTLPALLLALMLSGAPPLCAGTVTSPKPDAVSVTVYRNPDRNGGDIALDDLRGFALITETRTITLPAGETVVRFEGVADGILPASAVAIGLPGGVVEKNRDANLLSPAGLINASIGKAVTLVRTDRATGKARVVDAVLRSGPDGGVLFETAQGVEALRCSALPERLVFSAVPEGLSATPTLSVVTRTPQAVTARITLAYLARGFDWSAHYVATVRPDGQTLDLVGWVTLANGNGISFPLAQTQVVAGRLNREDEGDDDEPEPFDGAAVAGCWPWDTTSTYPAWEMSKAMPAPMSRILPAPYAMAMARDGEIIVTAKRASAEALGDLKLYRIPERTTVAASGQKQVLLMAAESVPFNRIHALSLTPDDTGDHETSLRLRMKNRKESQLGIALPSGMVHVFEDALGRSMLAGDAAMRDSAVNEEVELRLQESPGLRATVAVDPAGKDRYRLTLTNDRTSPADAEIGFTVDEDWKLGGTSETLKPRYGRPTWYVSVPAQGSQTLTYRYHQR